MCASGDGSGPARANQHAGRILVGTRQGDEARSKPGFHVYDVDNVRQGNPALFQLIDLHPDDLAGLLQPAQPQIWRPCQRGLHQGFRIFVSHICFNRFLTKR